MKSTTESEIERCDRMHQLLRLLREAEQESAAPGNRRARGRGAS